MKTYMNLQPQSSNRRRLFVTVGIACSIAILAVVASCSRQSHESEVKSPVSPTSVLRLGYRPKAIADITPVIMKEAGISRPSVALHLVAVSSPPDGWNKFKSSEVDALAGMPLASVFDQLAGTGPQRKFVAYFLQVDQDGEGWVALIGSKKLGISSVSDLAGKTVATLNTDQAEWLMRRILLAAGIPKDQTTVVRYNPATPLIGLRSGEHAAIFGLEPALSEAVSEGNLVLSRGPISHYLYNGQSVPVSASIISLDWLEQHPQAFKDFIQMMDESLKISTTKPDQVRNFFLKPEYGDLKPATTRLLSLPVMVKPNPSLKTVTEQYVDDMVRDGVLKEKVDLAPLVPSF